MKEFFANNYGTIIVCTILMISFVLAILEIKRSKKGCAFCAHADTCVIKKIKNVE